MVLWCSRMGRFERLLIGGKTYETLWLIRYEIEIGVKIELTHLSSLDEFVHYLHDSRYLNSCMLADHPFLWKFCV